MSAPAEAAAAAAAPAGDDAKGKKGAKGSKKGGGDKKEHVKGAPRADKKDQKAAPAAAQVDGAAAPAAAAGDAKKDKKPKADKKDKKEGAAADDSKKEKAVDWFIAHRMKVWDEVEAKRKAEAEAKQKSGTEKKIVIELPDGKKVDGIAGVTSPMEVAKKLSNSLAQKIVISKVNEVSWDLTRPLEGDCKLRLIDFDSKEGAHTFWHSSAHILGQALEIEFPGARLCVGPPIDEGGFYYDVSLPAGGSVKETDFKSIEKNINSIIKAKQPFVRLSLSKAEALEMFKDNKFKQEIIRDKVPDGAFCTAYRCGPLIDLCKGPHVPDTARIKAMSVTKNSSCYWKGDAKNDSLQRVYGISFPDKDKLKEYQELMNAAAERDHRRIGLQQKLFFSHEWSPGSAFFMPMGARIYNTLIGFIKNEYRKRGYSEVVTPNVFNVDLWKTSGHYANYKDNMFLFEVEKQEFAMKPMNCPGHCLMFGHELRSFRELPVRLADFGVLHRNEISGALSGLTRVRRFQQDDAHIFCRPDQIEVEVAGVLDFLKFTYGVFGFDYALQLSTRPEAGYLGEIKTWDEAEDALKSCLDKFCKSVSKQWTLNKGDGAFYGPKIDIQLFDALKRKHQCATIQLDFQLPERFKLQYKNSDGLFPRPVIIHRAILGSVERMMAVLIEHTAGKWPFWLSPRQVCVVPVAQNWTKYAEEVYETMKGAGFHADIDDSKKQLPNKIRECFIEQWNYIIVVGEKEEKARTVTLTCRERPHTKDQFTVTIQECIQLFNKLRDTFAQPQAPEAAAATAAAPASGAATAAAGTAAPKSISKYAACSGECFVLALVYIDRIIQSNPTFVVNSLNIHRLLITSVMLAAKFFDDQYFNNAYYAKVGGVPCNEMNSLEVEFLFMTNFTLFVATDTYRQYYTELCNHASNSSCGCSQMQIPKLVIPPGPNEQGGIKQRLRGDSKGQIKTGEVEGDPTMITDSPAITGMSGNDQKIAPSQVPPSAAAAAAAAAAAVSGLPPTAATGTGVQAPGTIVVPSQPSLKQLAQQHQQQQLQQQFGQLPQVPGGPQTAGAAAAASNRPATATAATANPNAKPNPNLVQLPAGVSVAAAAAAAAAVGGTATAPYYNPYAGKQQPTGTAPQQPVMNLQQQQLLYQQQQMLHYQQQQAAAAALHQQQQQQQAAAALYQPQAAKPIAIAGGVAKPPSVGSSMITGSPPVAPMLADLKDMKRELLPTKEEKDPANQNLDDYGRQMMNLTKLLAEIRVEVDRLGELRQAAPDGRDLNTIRIANDNLKNLKKATDMWKDAKAMIIKDAAKKKVDEKTIDDRKRKLTLLFDEIKELSNKNSSVKIEKSAIEKDIDAKKAERERRRKEQKAKAKSRRRAKRDGEGGDGGDDTKGDDKDDLDDIEMRPVQPASAQEQEFMANVQKNKEEQDAMLDEILKGVTELGDIAKAIKTQIDIGSAMADELDTKLDKTIQTFKTSNARLQEILEELIFTLQLAAMTQARPLLPPLMPPAMPGLSPPAGGTGEGAWNSTLSRSPSAGDGKSAPVASAPSASAAGATPSHHDARPPATISLDSASNVPWLSDDTKDSVVAPPAQPLPRIGDGAKMPPGIVRIKDGEDLWKALDELKLMYSMDVGTSCCGRVIDNGEIGVLETQGQVSFVKPGQWKIWSYHTTWSNPPTHSISRPIIRAKGVTIVTLNQRQVLVAKDQDGRSMLLSSGRFILSAPAVLIDRDLYDDEKNIISLVDLPKQIQVQRFSFFAVPQGEVAGITLPSGKVSILLPGVHIVEDCKFERFLPTVPIQSKLKKEVITSDMVTVSLEVDIATQLVDCARFLKMSATVTHSADGKQQQQQSVGCKDLYDAIEESAQSHFVDTFGKTQYYNFRTRQGEVESKFEESALDVLDREARKYGGRILKINILKQRADAVEAVYASHNSKQIELEQKKQSQQRQYDIDDSDQKHKQLMAERDEKGSMLKQTLQQERELAAKQHALKLQLQDAKAAQEKLDYESKAIAERQKMQAISESESAKVRAQGGAEQQASQILIVAQANAKAEELRGMAAAKSEDVKAQARVAALSALAEVLKANPAMLELERQRVHDELQVKKLQALVEAGAKVIPVELMKMMDVADERVLKRLENQAVLNVMGGRAASGADNKRNA